MSLSGEGALFGSRSSAANHPHPLGKTFLLAMAAISVATPFLCHCRPTGAWELTQTDPPGVPFPLQRLELDASGSFKATSTAFGERVHTYGNYRWRGQTLLVHRPGFNPQRYHVRRRSDGRLEFVYRLDGRRITAVFEPAPPQETFDRPADQPYPEPDSASPLNATDANPDSITPRSDPP